MEIFLGTIDPVISSVTEIGKENIFLNQLKFEMEEKVFFGPKVSAVYTLFERVRSGWPDIGQSLYGHEVEVFQNVNIGTRPIVSIIEGPSNLAGQDLLCGQRKTRRDKNTVLVRF